MLYVVIEPSESEQELLEGSLVKDSEGRNFRQEAFMHANGYCNLARVVFRSLASHDHHHLGKVVIRRGRDRTEDTMKEQLHPWWIILLLLLSNQFPSTISKGSRKTVISPHKSFHSPRSAPECHLGGIARAHFKRRSIYLMADATCCDLFPRKSQT